MQDTFIIAPFSKITTANIVEIGEALLRGNWAMCDKIALKRHRIILVRRLHIRIIRCRLKSFGQGY